MNADRRGWSWYGGTLLGEIVLRIVYSPGPGDNRAYQWDRQEIPAGIKKG